MCMLCLSVYLPLKEGWRKYVSIRKKTVLQNVIKYCQSGWPEQHDIPESVKPYYSVAAELTVEKGLLMRGSQVVIPASLHGSILCELHDGHQGITKCRERAKYSVWWPGLSKQLESTVKSCQECLINTGIRATSSLSSPTTSLAKGWHCFEWNKSTYLLTVDYFSRWIEIARLSNQTSEEVILHTHSMFARHGIPEVVVSDNGPQFSAELYAEFARQYGFEHITSSPYHPQCNGEAERAVKTMKCLLKKSGDHYLALLA